MDSPGFVLLCVTPSLKTGACASDRLNVDRAPAPQLQVRLDEQVFHVFKFYSKMHYASHKDLEAEKFLKHRKRVQPLARQQRKERKEGRVGRREGWRKSTPNVPQVLRDVVLI